MLVASFVFSPAAPSQSIEFTGELDAVEKSATEVHRQPMTTDPRLYRVILPVDDIDKAVAFFATVLAMPGERVSPGRHYFNLGGTILAVYDPEADGDGNLGSWRYHPNQYIYVAVDDLDAAVERARAAGARLESEQPQAMPWGERLFYIVAPSGGRICFVDAETLFLGSQRTEASK